MDIMDFISNFKKSFPQDLIESFFTESNCYHFAVIMKNLFDGTIIYDFDRDHFSLEYNNKYYDITGEIEEPFSGHIWDDMEDDRPLDYEIIRDICVLKK